jgi:hypothetical protein
MKRKRKDEMRNERNETKQSKAKGERLETKRRQTQQAKLL